MIIEWVSEPKQEKWDEECEYLYMLTDPRKGNDSAYIGKSKNPDRRYREHLTVFNVPGHETRKHIWIKDLQSLGLKPIMMILDELELFEAEQAEKDVIAMCRAIRGEYCLNSLAYRFSRWVV